MALTDDNCYAAGHRLLCRSLCARNIGTMSDVCLTTRGPRVHFSILPLPPPISSLQLVGLFFLPLGACLRSLASSLSFSYAGAAASSFSGERVYAATSACGRAGEVAVRISHATVPASTIGCPRLCSSCNGGAYSASYAAVPEGYCWLFFCKQFNRFFNYYCFHGRVR